MITFDISELTNIYRLERCAKKPCFCITFTEAGDACRRQSEASEHGTVATAIKGIWISGSDYLDWGRESLKEGVRNQHRMDALSQQWGILLTGYPEEM